MYSACTVYYYGTHVTINIPILIGYYKSMSYFTFGFFGL